MANGVLSTPLFDADNHRHGPQEAPTQYLADRYRGAADYVEVWGRTTIVIRAQISDCIPNPTFDLVARPGAPEDHLLVGNPDGTSRREIVGEPKRALPGFREPAFRIELRLDDPVNYMDELEGLHEKSVGTIMGGNVARLMNVVDAVAR